MRDGKDIVMNVDFFDHCWNAAGKKQGLYDKSRIEKLIENCAANGVSSLFWRITATGKASYQSKIIPVWDGDFRKNSYGLAAVLKKIDPLKVACDYAHKNGLKIYAWIDLFDDYCPGSESELGRKHPEYYWVDRSGEVHFRGIFCFAYPEVMRYKLAQVKEVSGYDIDGIYFCTRSHARLSCPYRQPDKFGFNEPIAKEYLRRYGVNIKKFEDVNFHIDSKHYLFGFFDEIQYIGGNFDRGKWHKLKGEYLTSFLKKSNGILKKKKQDLFMGILDPFEGYEGLNPMAQMYLDWKNWAKKKIVDGLVLIGTPRRKLPERVRIFHQTSNFGMKLFLWHDAYSWDEKGRGVYFWSSFKDIAKSAQDIRQADKAGLADGYVLHEAAVFEFSQH